MGRFDPAAKAARLAQQVRTTDWKGRAKQAVQTLKDEYEAGKRGDDTPAQPIWASPREQLDAVLGLLRSAAPAPAPAADTADTADTADVERDERRAEPVELADDRPAQDAAAFDADADEVAEALRRVDWTRVRAATAERSSDAARTVRAMAEQVDWTRVQPVAAQVSSARIAAVASGQLGVGGRLGTTVARAIVDQGGLGQHVAARVASQHLAVPAELRRVIDATARDA